MFLSISKKIGDLTFGITLVLYDMCMVMPVTITFCHPLFV